MVSDLRFEMTLRLQVASPFNEGRYPLEETALYAAEAKPAFRVREPLTLPPGLPSFCS